MRITTVLNVAQTTEGNKQNVRTSDKRLLKNWRKLINNALYDWQSPININKWRIRISSEFGIIWHYVDNEQTTWRNRDKA